MAEGLEQLAQQLTSAKPLGQFVPRPFYEPHTDSLIYYHRNVRSYGQRINKYVTLFLAVADDSLVGVEIKGFKSTMVKAIHGLGDVQLLEPLKVKNEDGETMDLALVMRCALIPEADAPLEEHYASLNRMTKGVKVPKAELCGA